jgi:hypothetical protein
MDRYEQRMRDNERSSHNLDRSRVRVREEKESIRLLEKPVPESRLEESYMVQKRGSRWLQLRKGRPVQRGKEERSKVFMGFLASVSGLAMVTRK